MTLEVLTSVIETEGDIVAVRQQAKRLGELIGFDGHYQTRIAAAVSEVARFAFSESDGAKAEFTIKEENDRQAFWVRISCSRLPVEVEAVIDGTGQTQNYGLAGAKRLMDYFRIAPGPSGGTLIEFGQNVPADAGPITKKKAAEIGRTISRHRSDDTLAILREQNRDLMQSLEEIKRRKEESEHLSSELSDTNRGVVALYAELDERAEQLKRASELKSHFLSNVSHEFRTPLNSILALCQLLNDRTDGALTSEQDKQVGFIRQSASNLLELVNDLLDLAKVEAGKIELRPTCFSVRDLFGALRGALKPLSSNAAVELVFHIDGDTPVLYTDEAKIAQILRNLISNALKFTIEGEVRVVASYDAETEQLTVSVMDTGIGIEPENLEQVFEEFSQVETPLHLTAKGTGLGLPLSRNLATLLGGKIQVQSVPGQGSVFTLIAPAPDAIVATAAAKTKGDKKLILVVDDDETFQYVFRHMAGDDPRFSLRGALSGEEAILLAVQIRPDAIVLDLQMPQMDGFTVLQQLQSNPTTRNIPVLISTSLAETPGLRAKLPAGISILSKSKLSRDNVVKALSSLIGNKLAS